MSLRIMPFGKHKGTRMEEVPPIYLLFLYAGNRCSKDIAMYVFDNLDDLKHKAISEINAIN